MKKIMIIEDSEDMIYLMSILFGRDGHLVLAARSGHVALHYLQDGAKPDLIFLDQNMDGMTGTEFLQFFQAHYPDLYKTVPTIMISGHEPKTLEGCGATEILRKPVDVSDIESLVAKYIGSGKELIHEQKYQDTTQSMP